MRVRVCLCAQACLVFSLLLSWKLPEKLKAGGRAPAIVPVLAPSGSRAPGVLAFVSVIFKTPLQPCFPLITECCRRAARGRDNGAIGGQLAAR